MKFTLYLIMLSFSLVFSSAFAVVPVKLKIEIINNADTPFVSCHLFTPGGVHGNFKIPSKLKRGVNNIYGVGYSHIQPGEPNYVLGEVDCNIPNTQDVVEIGANYRANYSPASICILNERYSPGVTNYCTFNSMKIISKTHAEEVFTISQPPLMAPIYTE